MTIDDLKAYGANTAEGLTRCMNNEAFYLRLVNMIPNDASFEKMYAAVEAGDLDTAFDAAHALKGSTGNLSLTPIYAPVAELSDLLKVRTKMDYSDLVAKVRKAQDELRALCAK